MVRYRQTFSCMYHLTSGWKRATLKSFFERYADDVVVHCKKEKQALFLLKQISHRLTKCNLNIHSVKTKIVNLRGISEKKYPKSYDFLGITILPNWCKIKERMLLVPSVFIGTKSKSSVLDKFRKMNIHKRRKPIEELAKELK